MADENPEDNYRQLLPAKPLRTSIADRPGTAFDIVAIFFTLVGLGGGMVAITGYMPNLLWPLPALMAPACIAIAMAAPSGISLGEPPKRSRRVSLGPALFGALIWLGVGAAREFHTLIWDQAVLWNLAAAAGGGVAMAALIARADRQDMSDGLMLVFGGICGALWSAGLLLQLNGALPPRAVPSRPSVVADRSVFHLRHSATSHVVWIAPRDGGDVVRMSVNSDVYKSLAIGERVCLFEPEGPLRLRWREVDRCPPVLD